MAMSIFDKSRWHLKRLDVFESLAVQEGDRVQKGQVLAELNTDSLTIQAQQAQAQLQVQQQTLNEQAAGNRPEEITQAKAKVQSAQAQFENADKQYQRLNVLNRSTAGQAVSKQEVDAAKSNMKMAEAAVGETKANLELLLKGARTEDREAAKAQYESTKANLDLIDYQITQSKLLAPVNGVIRARLQEVGDMTTSNKSVYTIALIHPEWVRVYASEMDLGYINMGAAAQVIRDSQPNQPITRKNWLYLICRGIYPENGTDRRYSHDFGVMKSVFMSMTRMTN